MLMTGPFSLGSSVTPKNPLALDGFRDLPALFSRVATLTTPTATGSSELVAVHTQLPTCALELSAH
jgi:hypothetical protein